MTIKTNIEISCTDTTEARLLLGCLLVAQDALASNQTNNRWRTTFEDSGMAYGGNHAGWIYDHICALKRALPLEVEKG